MKSEYLLIVYLLFFIIAVSGIWNKASKNPKHYYQEQYSLTSRSEPVIRFPNHTCELWAFGDDYDILQIKDLADAWNAEHPLEPVSGKESLFDLWQMIEQRCPYSETNTK